ncbi:DNA polymerase I [Helicobacter turcicus]|uniref:DNA polymerase I n=1 Tax=Helicobacter turcicus TaxID=2867412 RepID=A0ABS7JNC6_9HELI|nr:DNA polymerase I [Helicobacter turcicus]MBX7490877.1 DNA polymerase I [Helicobacter turcicus]MBX7545731.1 DNA polymerase I [Helicobacter turcicus]
MKTLTIIDTFGFLFRSYFALPPLKNREGFPTGLLTGFAKLIMQLHRDYPNDYLVFALDSKEENFRKSIDPFYKANRPEAPEDLKLQLEVAITWVEQMGFKNISIAGYEADDVIASINKCANALEVNVRIISHDKDLYQLIDGDTFLFDPKSKQEIREEQCIEKYGVTPSQFIDYQSIVGDSADNVPGIKGIGAKGATNLLKSYGSLDNIYQNLDSITPMRTQMLLKKTREDAYRSRQLVRLRDDLLDSFNLQDCKMPRVSPLLNIIESLQEYEIHSVLKKLPIKEKGGKREVSSHFHYQAILVENSTMLKNLMAQITPDSIVSFDTETTDLDVLCAKIVGFSFSFDGINAYYAPIAHNYLGAPEQISKELALTFITALFNAKMVIGHNIKYDLEILRTNFNFTPKSYHNIKDSMLLAWLYQSDMPCNLDDLMHRYFKHTMIAFKDIIKKGENFSQLPIESAFTYACEDAAACYQLFHKINALLLESLKEIANNVEFPFIQCLVNMELSGTKINIEYFKNLKTEMAEKLQALSCEIYTLANKRFNLNSPQQLSIVLFEELNLQSGKKTKSGLSTNSSVLNSIKDAHPIIPKVLEYRELFKLYSTYIEPLIELASQDATHKVYTSFMQTGTSTGRLSSKNPNLQNIPVKTQQGRRIREGFIAQDGHLLLSLDYSQIELRLLAHFSKDSAMIEAFYKEADIHLETAKKIFGETQAKEKRSVAKSINFGLIYGMGARKLSETLQISYQEAKTYIQNYFESFPTVKDFLKEQEEFILQNGYSLTLLGRMRKFNFQNIQDFQKAAFLREGINAIFQGSAADIIKLAMIQITQEKLESKLLLQVHDELIFEAPKHLAEIEAQKITQIMENITTLRVPLRCGVSLAKNWGELKG